MSGNKSFSCYAAEHHGVKSCDGCAESRQCEILSELETVKKDIREVFSHSSIAKQGDARVDE